MNRSDLMEARKQVLGSIYQMLVRWRNTYWEYYDKIGHNPKTLKNYKKKINELELQWYDCQNTLDPEKPERELK
jgi:hypothetical protein